MLGLLAVASFAVAQGLHAEIHRWQDANGKWHFSDSPRQALDQPRVIGSAPARTPDASLTDSDTDIGGDTTSPTSGPIIDLEARLSRQFEGANPATKASLAVVAIETSIGSGSGFFVSDDGLIITNRHVVRPEETPQWAEQEKVIESRRADLARMRHELDKERRSLGKMQETLEDYQRYISAEPRRSPRRESLQDDHDMLKSRYDSRSRDLQTYEKNYKWARSEFDKVLKDRQWRGAIAGVARSFKVFLKDDSHFQAQLVAVSDKQDLALLRIEGVRTPSLRLADDRSGRQGETVHAIGSPLGIRDSMTTGTLTRIDTTMLFTDARIFPGNSGGPLIRDDGTVIGVNTVKVAPGTAMAEGFGGAIPAALVRQTFLRWLP